LVTADQWATMFLKDIGAPQTKENVAIVVAWGMAESGSPSAGAQSHGGWTNYNPLNIVTQANDSHVGQGGSQGDIADFADAATGAAQSARLFTGNAAAAPIINALRGKHGVSAVNDAINGFYATWGGGPLALNINAAQGKSGGGGIIGSTLGVGRGLANTVVGSTLGVDTALAGSLFPGAGNVFGALTAPAKLATAFFGLFTNWRYVAEVFAGLAMIGVGLLLILHDTGVTKKAGQVATVAAVA
jgi:hypothetical protein